MPGSSRVSYFFLLSMRLFWTNAFRFFFSLKFKVLIQNNSLIGIEEQKGLIQKTKRLLYEGGRTSWRDVFSAVLWIVDKITSSNFIKKNLHLSESGNLICQSQLWKVVDKVLYSRYIMILAVTMARNKKWTVENFFDTTWNPKIGLRYKFEINS